MEQENTPGNAAGNWLIYDGECPFCSAYVRMLNFKKNAGDLRLIDAREGGPEFDEAVKGGFDLDEGMLLKMSGQYFHGSDCVHVLALLTRQNDVFGRLNGWIFRSRWRSAVFYPVLRAGRGVVLKALGRSKLSET